MKALAQTQVAAVWSWGMREGASAHKLRNLPHAIKRWGYLYRAIVGEQSEPTYCQFAFTLLAEVADYARAT